MSDMRLIVAGAGGRMGRTLVKAIAETKGLALAGALEDARSPLIGWDAGILAGVSELGVKLVSDPATVMDKADGVVDFTIPTATMSLNTDSTAKQAAAENLPGASPVCSALALMTSTLPPARRRASPLDPACLRRCVGRGPGRRL